MATRKDVLWFLDITLSILSDVRQIIAIVPDFRTLQHHLSMFRDFLYKEYQDK